MVPTAAGPQPLTEQEYWRDYDIIRNDVNAAMVACYTHRTINHVAATDFEILERMNGTPDFWRTTSFSLQSTLFIVLARMLDNDDNVHSVYKVLNATTAHPEFFSRDALRARKLSIPGTNRNPPYLDEYFRMHGYRRCRTCVKLKRALAPHKTKFDSIYKPIRNQIAHIILKDDTMVADLYSKTLKTHIDEILCFLHNLIRSIWYLAFNATEPNLSGDNYGYAGRAKKITEETERFMRQIP